MSDQTSYDHIVERYEAAYAAFNRTYEIRTPPPQRVKVQRENTLVLLALTAMVIASVIVSGSRTIVAFGGGVIGVAGFVMIECTIIAYAFIGTRTDYDAAKHSSVKRRVRQGMWLAFVVGVSSNIYAELKSNGVELPSQVDIGILLVLAISAPVLAFISGDVLGMYAVKNEQRQRKADEEYTAALLIWNEARKASWDAQKARWGVKIEVAREAPTPVEIPQVVGNFRQLPTIAHPTPKLKKTLAHLREHPEDMETESRALGARIGVSHTLVNEAKKHIKIAANGHANGSGGQS